jgi:hypothetical protein
MERKHASNSLIPAFGLLTSHLVRNYETVK